MGDVYIALKDCYFAGKLMKANDTITVAPGTVVKYPWLKKISSAKIEKPVAKSTEMAAKKSKKKVPSKAAKKVSKDEKTAAIREKLEQ